MRWKRKVEHGGRTGKGEGKKGGGGEKKGERKRKKERREIVFKLWNETVVMEIEVYLPA